MFKHRRLPILAFLFFVSLFLATSSFVLAVNNPAPPIGIPCGNTMCLPGEMCTRYPGETDSHCVPDPINTSKLPDCETVLGTNQGTFPPNIKCWNRFMNAQTDLTLYKKTCIYEPIANYSDKRELDSGEQSFLKCGKGESGPGGPPAPGGGDPACDVHMLVNTDVQDALLGSYGPDASASSQYSIDFLAQNYLYSSIFDRPMDLSNKNREAYRTYWRLLPGSNQANLRSYVMNMANQKLISNINFEFTDNDGRKKSTSFTKLYDALKKQVILFWHFPFVRIGCLTDYPVCPEYAQAQRELKPVFEDLTLLADQLNLGPIVDLPISLYRGAINAFGGDLNGPYEAFVPLEFDSVRGYIVKKKDDIEQAAYDKYPVLQKDTVTGIEGFRLTNVSGENLPYVGAIYQGLLSPKFGMIPTLQPQWITSKYSTAGAAFISDYKMGNAPENLPEVNIAHKNFLEQIADDAKAIIKNPLQWALHQINRTLTNIFDPDHTKKKGYTDNHVDNIKDEIVEQYANMQMCPLPVSYHLLSPKTADKYINPENGQIERPDDHHQIITIPGKQLEWSFTPSCQPIDQNCNTDPITGQIICRPGICPRDPNHYENNGECCTRKWSVSGVQHGKTLTVLNNPKQTDIKKAVAGEDQISLYKMLLPDGSKAIDSAEIDAPIAKHLNTQGGGLATAPTGQGSVSNPYQSIVRENNLAQDSMHALQNCWTVPEKLQNSPRCKPASSSATPVVEACKGEVFAQIVANPDSPSAKAQTYFTSSILPRLTPEVISAYAAAEAETGVPCEVLAGIHFEEGDNSPDRSLQDGSPLNGKTLKESAIQAATELLGKAGGSIPDLNTLIKALSYYNGGGNSNCQAGNSYNCSRTINGRCGVKNSCDVDPSGCSCGAVEPGSCRNVCTAGFPWKFDYAYCPPQTTGYDDPYVTNWWKSPEHDNMYLLYMYDCTQTQPQIHTRPGSLTVAISLFLSEQKK